MSKAFQVVRDFEKQLAEYSGSKYAVTVDSCTNAIFLACMYIDIKDKEVTIPNRTYVSVPCSIIHARGIVKFEDYAWKGIYRLDPYPIIDGAKRFRKDMYEKGTYHCLSFHARKHLNIGRGGAILTDNKDAVDWFKQARFDGRHECKLEEDTFNIVGWNYYMTPEQAARGLLLLGMLSEDNDDLMEIPDYPDLSKYEIYKK